MQKIMKNVLFLAALSITLSACSTFFDKDNTPAPTPLVNFRQVVSIRPMWSTHVGTGAPKEYLKLGPAISGARIFTVSKDGVVAATNKFSGKTEWVNNTRRIITSGVSANDDLVFVGTHNGDILALTQNNGKIAWSAHASSEILAPVIEGHGVVLAKTIDGRLTAFSDIDGHELWSYQQNVPTLVLRAASAPKISGDTAIVGFENGTLTKLSLHQGSVIWQQPIAEPTGSFAIQRMIDIDADPIIIGNRIYAATYQGHISALDLASGNPYWEHDISTFSGIAADDARVYVSDAQSRMWAFNSRTGEIDWHLNKLYARNITGPAVMGNYIVVGDGEGYLHWINKNDGTFAARTFLSKSGIVATPIVQDGIIYLYTQDGRLTAYTLT